MTCNKCNGTGHYQYDENHMTICPICCDHSTGWWELSEHHAGYIPNGDNRCCRKGCGTLARVLKEESEMKTKTYAISGTVDIPENVNIDIDQVDDITEDDDEDEEED
jgi:hypothetical protein